MPDKKENIWVTEKAHRKFCEWLSEKYDCDVYVSAKEFRRVHTRAFRNAFNQIGERKMQEGKGEYPSIDEAEMETMKRFKSAYDNADAYYAQRLHDQPNNQVDWRFIRGLLSFHEDYIRTWCLALRLCHLAGDFGMVDAELEGEILPRRGEEESSGND